MRLTVRFPGVEPAVIEQAHREGITVTEAYRRREQEGFGLLAEACEANLAAAGALLEQVRPVAEAVARGWLRSVTEESTPMDVAS